MPRKQLTDIERIGRKWQRKLRLTGWDITFGRVPTSQLQNSTDYANINWDIPSGSAFVMVSEEVEQADLEPSIVHELLHLRTEGHKPCDGGYDDHMEQNIEALTKCLLRL